MKEAVIVALGTILNDMERGLEKPEIRGIIETLQTLPLKTDIIFMKLYIEYCFVWYIR